MAKQGSKTGTSKIRFIMLEAEIPEGDLDQITQAIQNALKPTTIVQRVAAQQAPLLTNGSAAVIDDDQDVIDADAEVEAPPVNSAKPRVAKVRKPTTPDVIQADFDTDVSLQAFADARPAKGEVERNLVIAVWFAEHRDTPVVTASHIYTGYRKLGWSAGFEDFAWPLRAIKRDKLAGSPNRGEYEINHLAIDRVMKLGKGE